jgi:hypothetical protein
MRRFGAVVLLAVASGGCGGGKQGRTSAAGSTAGPRPVAFRASLSAPTHRPRVGSKWWYVVRAVDLRGRPLRVRLTVQVVDPLGTAHTAEVGTSTRKLLNFPVTGRYRDFAQWPAAARGYRLTLRVVVKAGGSSRTLVYWVRPR